MRRLQWRVVLLGLGALVGLGAGPPKTNEQAGVVISRPAQKETVGVQQVVAGKVSLKGSRVWVVIQPRETSDCWVQMPGIVNNDGTWEVSAQFGEDIAAHSGKKYEVRALANPKDPLRPGKVACWPEAEAYSDPVYVVRR